MIRSFPSGASGKEPTCQCRRHKSYGFDPWVRKIPWSRDNPHQYSCLENPMDRGTWRVHWVARGGHDLVAKPPGPGREGERDGPSGVRTLSRFTPLFAFHPFLFVEEETSSERVSKLLKDAQQMVGRAGLQPRPPWVQA